MTSPVIAHSPPLSLLFCLYNECSKQTTERSLEIIFICQPIFFLLLLHSAHSLLSDIFLLSLYPSLFFLHISISPHNLVQRKKVFVKVSFVTRQRGSLCVVICALVHSKRVHMFTDAFVSQG